MIPLGKPLKQAGLSPYYMCFAIDGMARTALSSFVNTIAVPNDYLRRGVFPPGTPASPPLQGKTEIHEWRGFSSGHSGFPLLSVDVGSNKQYLRDVDVLAVLNQMVTLPESFHPGYSTAQSELADFFSPLSGVLTKSYTGPPVSDSTFLTSGPYLSQRRPNRSLWETYTLQNIV